MKPNALLCLAFVASFALATPCKAAEIVLRLKASQNLGEPHKQLIHAFDQEIKVRDKVASLRFEVQKGAPNQVSESRVVEISLSPLAEFDARVPAAGLFSLPFLFNFDAIVYAAAKPGSEIRKLVDSEIEKTGVRVLWWHPYGNTVVFSKGTPLVNPRHLAKHKILVPDASSAEFIRMCGGSAVTKSGPEQTASSRREAFDAMMSSIYAIQDNDDVEGLNIINNISYSTSLFIAVTSKENWEILTRDQRTIIMEAARAAEESGWARSAQDEAEAFDLALQKGMTIETISADDILAWRSCSSAMLESFLNRTETIGAKLLAAYGKLRSDPCCSQPLQTQTND